MTQVGSPHPLLCFLANTGEAMSGLLRPGNAGANTATDHITLLDQALAQIPDAHRHGSAAPPALARPPTRGRADHRARYPVTA